MSDLQAFLGDTSTLLQGRSVLRDVVLDVADWESLGIDDRAEVKAKFVRAFGDLGLEGDYYVNTLEKAVQLKALTCEALPPMIVVPIFRSVLRLPGRANDLRRVVCDIVHPHGFCIVIPSL